MSETTTHVFGPVPSRRLGRSLGVDLIPRKVCSFDCVYCQVGRTTRKSVVPERFVDTERILQGVREKLEAGPRPDYITLSGSGEPTLHAGIAEIISGIKTITDVPVAVMTNGSLFYDPAVRRACLKADLILPTLDAPDEASFQAVHRPEASLTLDRVVEGLVALRAEYRGQIWLEVFLVAGMNVAPEQLRRLRTLIARIRPDRVQLNTAVRPTAEPGVRALTEAELEEVARLLDLGAEVIADFRRPAAAAAHAPTSDAALEMIRRRPVTAEDIAAGLGLAREKAEEMVRELEGQGKIAAEARDGKTFYVAR